MKDGIRKNNDVVVQTLKAKIDSCWARHNAARGYPNKSGLELHLLGDESWLLTLVRGLVHTLT